MQRLRYVDVASKAVTQVDQDKYGEIESLRLVAGQPVDCLVAAGRERAARKFILYSAANKQSVPRDRQLVSARVTSSFSDDGKYLLLSSARDFKPTFGRGRVRECLSRHASGFISSPWRKKPRIAARAAQRRSGQSEKEKEKETGKKAGDKKAEAKESDPSDKKNDAKEPKPKKPVVVKVDVDGIHDRIAGLEITPG